MERMVEKRIAKGTANWAIGLSAMLRQNCSSKEPKYNKNG
jgi:hypothetical protein